MANFDTFKQKALNTMDVLAEKSVELYKIAEEKTRLFAKMTKLTAEMTFAKGDLRKHYRELGKMYYELHKLSPEAELAQLCDEVTASLDTIEAKQRDIDALRSFAEFEPLDEDDDDSDDSYDEQASGMGFEPSAPGHIDDAFRTRQDTDTLEEPEGDVGLGQTPPTFRL